ncbi:MAG: sigma-54-dependent Fis family transcriptional regulator [candidate division Zixibacteria bacterium]|nr:sigma-54-dependent Fis family transcriptional regulator [candidate division Zixibacteria bacterium]
MKFSVLVVDDDKLVNDFVVESLKRAGYSCQTVMSGEEAVIEIEEAPFDVVLLDLKMKGMDGIATLKQIKKLRADTHVVMMTAFGTVETAVRAMKFGAADFLLKPVSPETLEFKLAHLTELIQLKADNEQMRQDLFNKFHNMIGKSKVMQNVFDLINSIANARSTVMITGPSGTGKELVARSIHLLSQRRNKPFIKLNCAALPENLVEAELFGYEKGAFTDAKKTSRGRFELADGGGNIAGKRWADEQVDVGRHHAVAIGWHPSPGGELDQDTDRAFSYGPVAEERLTVAQGNRYRADSARLPRARR